jgi:hypothetical protein
MCDSFRDTMAATLDMEGYWIPPFYVKSQYANASYASGRRPPSGEKPVKGMNIVKMKEYADHIAKFTDEPTLLCWDRLSSHRSKEVVRYFESKKCSDGRQKFKIKDIPPKGAFLVSPLDFGFFGMWKGSYYKYDRSTPELKFFAANQTWNSITSDQIRQFFKGCFLIGNLPESTLRKKLRSHVRSGIPEKLEEVWDFYDGWMSGAFSVDGVSAPREVPLDKPLQLLDSELSGVYWRNWGLHGHKP